MNVFYNKEGIGDTLIIKLQEIDKEHLTYEKKGQVVRIYDAKSNETAGYNVFKISESLQIAETGHVEVTEDLLQKINEVLAESGFTAIVADLSPKFVVGYVKEKEKHPNADKLSVCKVDVGGEDLQIVCGAANVAAGQKVVVAKVGAVMPSGLVIKDAELRGVASSGMICSAKELALPDAPEEKGILVLTDDFVVGAEFPLS